MSAVTATLTIPARLTCVPCVRYWLGGLLHEWSVPTAVATDLLLAVTEICTNIIRHGYGETGTGDIALRLRRHQGVIRVTIQDSAPVFVLHDVNLPAPETLAEGGYGLFLIKALMDEIIYESVAERGNCVTLVKYEAAPPCLQ